jgi:hypothetical protein
MGRWDAAPWAPRAALEQDAHQVTESTAHVFTPSSRAPQWRQ